MPSIAQLVAGLVAKVLGNQLTKQNINDEIQDIDRIVNYEHNLKINEKNVYIMQLEAKLNELNEKLDSMANAVVDNVVEKIQEKTPFFLDGVVHDVGEQVKQEIDELTDAAVEKIVDVVEQKAEDFGLIEKTEESEEEEVVPETETELEPSPIEPVDSKPSLFSDSANKILNELKKKH